MKFFKSSFNRYLLLAAISFVAIPVFASEFSFDTQSKNVSVGGQFQVDLNINTNKESINTVGGEITFPTAILDLSEIRSANSIVNFWVDKPAYKDGKISFSGITPGGYVLDKGLVLSLIFTAKKEGVATIKIGNVSALKNDGSGTPSKIKTSDLTINILSEGKIQGQNLTIVDNDKPDTFVPEIGQDQNILDGKWFVAFVAQDKGTGIARYQIKETRYNIFDFSKWANATSPYILSDQELHSYIYVRAIDNVGNERIAKLSPKNPIPWYANVEDWFIIVLVIGIVALIFFSSKMRKQK